MRLTSGTTRTALVALALSALAAAPANAAPDPGSDAAQAGWLAWHGCWEVADGPAVGEGSMLVCVAPIDDASGAEIRTHLDGELVGVERMIADGRPEPIEEGGCAGERTAHWSADRARVFVRSHMRCAEGVTRETTGVMAMSSTRQGWLEIHSVRAGGGEPVLGVQHFVPARPATLDAHGVEAPGGDRELAVRTARAAATAPLDLDDVVEVVHEADGDVARALVAELGQPFSLDARSLREAAARGVPSELLDVLVAVSYPERFDIAGDSREAERIAPVGMDRRATAPWGGPRYGPGYRYRLSGFYSPFGWSPWHYDPYGYGTWRAPRVIVVQPSVIDRRVNPLEGYFSSRGTDRRATPRSGGPGAASSDGSARVTPDGVRRGSGAAGASGDTGSRATRQGSGGDQGGGRRASRRGGGGGDG